MTKAEQPERGRGRTDGGLTLYRLARRARSGDQEALAELVEELRASLFGIAYAELRHFEDAQDAVSETLLRICVHVGEVREPERMRQWAQGITRNEVRRIGSARRMSQSRVLSSPSGGSDGPDCLESIASQDDAYLTTRLRLDIQRALLRLPAVQAETAALFYLSGLSIREIAEREGRPIGTVKSLLHHARQRLASEMKEYAPAMNTPLNTAPMPTNAPSASPRRNALLLQTTLAPDVKERMLSALSAGNFSVSVPTEDEIHHKIAILEGTSIATDAGASAVDATKNVAEWLQSFSLLVLDHAIAGQPALAYLLNLKALPETHDTPIYVLLDGIPSVFLASAYYSAGVRGLIDKSNPNDNDFVADAAAAAEPLLSDVPWSRFTERARRVVLNAHQEALWRGSESVATEHLLLGLLDVPDCVGVRLLSEKLGLNLREVRSAIEADIQDRDGIGGISDAKERRGFASDATRALDLSIGEASQLGNDYIGAEHLLLGLLNEIDGHGGQVLRSLGVGLEQTRELVRKWQST